MKVRRLIVAVAALAFALVAIGGASALPRDPIEPPDLPPGGGGSGGAPFVRPANGFIWSVPSRFGRLDSRGVIDFHWREDLQQYDAAWLGSNEYPANFDACPTKSERDKANAGENTDNTYRWTLQDPAAAGGSATVSARDCLLRHVWHAEGTFGVDLIITGPDGSAYEGRTDPYHQSVRIRNLVIVSLGDSYGSGEGNPDRAQQVGWNPFKTVHQQAIWQSRRCHRSAYAGPAQAALAIERADPHTSVTFVSFACSGATIDTPYFGGGDPLDPYAPADPQKPIGTGVLGHYQGVEPVNKDDYNDRIPPQVDQLQAALQSRRIDALIVSGGGNDIGFGPIATVCVLYGDCKNHHVFGRFFEGPRRLEQRFAQDLAALPAKYDSLDAALTDTNRNLNIAKVYVTEYPDSTRDDDGSPCPEMLHDVVPWAMAPLLAIAAGIYSHPVPLPWYRLDASEAAWAGAVVLPGLNTKLAEAASRHGWTYVDGIDEAYAGPGYGHGYCADASWIRNATDSIAIQGPWYDGLPPDTSETKGTLHPNVRGHQVYKDRLLAYLLPDLLPGSSAPAPAPVFTSSSPTAVVGENGWIVDGAAVRVEATSAAGIRGAAVSVNGTGDCAVAGVTCTTAMTTETDGRVTAFRWDLTFAADGVYRLDFSASAENGGSGAFSREVKVDLHDPTSATLDVSGSLPSQNGWFRVPVSLEFSATDAAGGSGIAAIEYALDEGTFVRAGTDTPVAELSDGVHTVDYRAVDAAGRRNAVSRETVRIDRTAPEVTCASADGLWHRENVALACSASDAGGSSLEGASTFELTTSVAAGEETTDALTGSRTVCDGAGNCVDAGPIGGSKVDRKAPALTVPADKTLDATEPGGTPVPFSASAVDRADPNPAVVCVPSAGGLFPVGRTTVSCTATDAAGNSSTGSFQVRIKGAAEQIRELIEKARIALGLRALPPALETPLQQALSLLVTNKPVACRAMNTFIAAVRVLAGARRITAAQAADLTADAVRIRAALGCS